MRVLPSASPRKPGSRTSRMGHGLNPVRAPIHLHATTPPHVLRTPSTPHCTRLLPLVKQEEWASPPARSLLGFVRASFFLRQLMLDPFGIKPLPQPMEDRK